MNMHHPEWGEILRSADHRIGKKQRRPFFKLKRTSEVLTREQVKAIKKGRKILRKELKTRGIKKKEEFELMASSFGLYFDKGLLRTLLPWLFRGKGLLALGGLLTLLLTTLFLYSTVTQMRGHFTINMSDGMFREGFVLSETEDFAQPTTALFCEAAEDVPCISISHIPETIDDNEGQHNAEYFAYTYFIRNEGESTVDYDWTVSLNSESLDLSKAVWVMIFEDGEMKFYAEKNAQGATETLPAMDDNRRGYVGAPMIDHSASPGTQYQLIARRGNISYFRVIPENFIDDIVVAKGRQEEVAPMDVHKYTVVIWLEGDDPDCTDDMIGGHVGMEMGFQLDTEDSYLKKTQEGWLDTVWSGLKFWDN